MPREKIRAIARELSRYMQAGRGLTVNLKTNCMLFRASDEQRGLPFPSVLQSGEILF